MNPLIPPASAACDDPVLPAQPLCVDVLRQRYLQDGERTAEAVYDRVAHALASLEPPGQRARWARRFRRNLGAGAIGGGRIMAVAGTGQSATMASCFVQPLGDGIGEADDEGYPGLERALGETAQTLRQGGGVGIDFSRIRPRGSQGQGAAHDADGPCPVVDLFERTCATVESAGVRRGAMMGVLRIDHPDVLEFITAKRSPDRWRHFNVSVAVTDAFIEAVRQGRDWALVHRARPGHAALAQGARQRTDGQWVYRTLPAQSLWETVMQSAYDFAEPGILFIDRIQADNNLRALEVIHATNPCVTADTWVMTDAGARQVHELIGQPFRALVNGQAYPVESAGFFVSGIQPVLELQTCEGQRLRLTADHRVRRVARHTRILEWTPAGGLQPGDQIMLHDHRAAWGWGGPGTRAQGYRMGRRSGAKRITAEIERRSSEFYIGLLRGLFDAQGHVYGHQGRNASVRLRQRDGNPLPAVQRMLLRLGVVSTLSPRHRPAVSGRLAADGQGRAPDPRMHALHELVISGDHLHAFAQRVGFADSEKAGCLHALLAGGSHGLHHGHFAVTVSALLPCGQEPVYDVTVSDVHAFDANGLVVHNCGEQPLPPYGSCDLGPIILPRFVRHPFGYGGQAAFDFQAFARSVALQVRALDNVLDLSGWPLPQQQRQAHAKRRIGVGWTGLGDALVMLGLPYNAPEGRAMASRMAQCLRNAAYRASVALAIEKGPFPLFDARTYLAEGTFASRLPEEIRKLIEKHGLRNSHLLSIAPTGTVSLAFADNTSSGIEPAWAWCAVRSKREPDGSLRSYAAEDHAWRLFRSLGGDTAHLPGAFVTAHQIEADDHLAMMQAVQPFIDAAIAKTVNVRLDCPYRDFRQLYMLAWSAGLKGLATYRPNRIRTPVLRQGAV